ncbi:hypothetical protein [Rhodopseudomonas palustris]|uniref:Uncharacterized protein n=1 Tax=Rhodopseudomonas palustris (strain ATCC BAA-98 / CGA009) TaxID=258594 RepID=A0AAE9Y010_RHOPA|nr:hypothetical protein [Rhodopseudomonas palustris]WAB79659.1 hypothetical protein OR798_10300 [Rhodopseudomonas palustris]WCL92148.1 hypothetical protein TX73_010295 [Rhodopseudomonas palustris CGA009]WND53552.1 hypothetical protein L1A21_10265 [Rhodopseudomonas palustris]
MSVFSTLVMVGLDPAIHRTSDAAIVSMMDARVEPAHDVGVRGDARPHPVIPGRPRSGRTRNLVATISGFRVCAAGAAHPGMTALGVLAHDVGVRGDALPYPVIPGRAAREPGIHNHRREYGFRACALRAHPGMTNERRLVAAHCSFVAAHSSVGAAPCRSREFAAMATETTTALEIAR